MSLRSVSLQVVGRSLVDSSEETPAMASSTCTAVTPCATARRRAAMERYFILSMGLARLDGMVQKCLDGLWSRTSIRSRTVPALSLICPSAWLLYQPLCLLIQSFTRNTCHPELPSRNSFRAELEGIHIYPERHRHRAVPNGPCAALIGRRTMVVQIGQNALHRVQR